MFYAPWCVHCQKFSPQWEQLAEMLNEDDSDIKIAKVDCSTDSKVCLKEDITGYPTLKFYKLGDSNGIKFRGTRDLPSLTNFINEQLREGDEKDQESEEVPQVMKHGLVELTEKTFESHVATGNHFVKFYAPWCGYCQKLAPTWEELARSYQDNNDVTIAKVDCTQERKICDKFEVKGYPTLLWIENGKKIEKYKGERQHDNLKAFVEQMKQPDGVTRESEEVTDVPPETISVGELTANTFKLGIESGLSFVKFFAPWCGHCKRLSPIWDSLAEKFGKTDGVHISKVDCTLNVNKQLCNDEGIEGFPTLILYKDGAKLWEYTGSRSLDELSDFVKHHLERHDEL
ncbi:unnamed protein product [Acanthoscelides obtectus]|nr:unnamed protein product [Acanthoscelides obtectus]CAK1636117.1 Thioredoxin domain-containing protein 5 homolog [Acanthoscelides obtectus]